MQNLSAKATATCRRAITQIVSGNVTKFAARTAAQPNNVCLLDWFDVFAVISLASQDGPTSMGVADFVDELAWHGRGD